MARNLSGSPASPRWFDRWPDQQTSQTDYWGSEAFSAELRAWVAEQVGAVHTMRLTRLRPWSTVWRVATDAGSFFAKQNCLTQAAETAVIEVAAAVAPARVVPLAAVDLDRGLVLTEECGEELPADPSEDAWAAVVREGALLQRELAPAVDQLVGAGVELLTEADAGDYFAARVEQVAARQPGDPLRLAPGEAQRLRGLTGVVRRRAEQVAALGLPTTLNHNDLHTRNVRRDGERLRYFDFGDAVVSGPLQALLVPLNVAATQWSANPDDPRLRRVADAALEVWSDLAPMPALRAALPAALTLGRLARAESWVRVAASLSPDEAAEHGGAVPGWLATVGGAELISFDEPVGGVAATR